MIKKESFMDAVVRKTDKAFMLYLKSKTPEARIKKARAKVAAIIAKEKAEQAERVAKEVEIKYKMAHPKRFGIF